MSPKVSVVVPTYAPGERIRRLVRSLEAQTMPAPDFEIIFVDDGSPDDTWDRLQRIRDTHDNVVIERIENSGWAGRPRNVGLALARGEYVLFMDHDDELYPDALTAGHRYAAQHHADVLNAKEHKTSDPSWGATTYTADLPNALPKRGINALLPMMPHKLYRRQFLLDHDITFVEGRRVLWEDIYFNVRAFRHADVVSILSSVPFYKWVATGANTSSTYSGADTEFWDNALQLLEFLHSELDGDAFREPRESMLVHFYRSRVLNRCRELLSDTSGIDAAVPYLTRIHELVPESLDARLAPVHRAESYLLRRGETSAYRVLVTDQATTPHTELVRSCWVDRALELTTRTRWTVGADRPLALVESPSGDLLRSMPPELADVLPPELRDVSAPLAKTTAKLLLRETRRSETRLLATSTTLTTPSVGDNSSGEVTPVLQSTTRIPVADLLADGAGGPRQWDVMIRPTLLGASPTHHVTSRQPACLAVARGTLVVVRPTRTQRLNVYSPTARSTAHGAVLTWADAGGLAGLNLAARPLEAATHAEPPTFTMPLDGVHADGELCVIGYSVPRRFARLISRAARTRFAARTPLAAAGAGADRTRRRFGIRPLELRCVDGNAWLEGELPPGRRRRAIVLDRSALGMELDPTRSTT